MQAMPDDLEIEQVLREAFADTWDDGELRDVLRYLADNRYCTAPAQWSEGF